MTNNYSIRVQLQNGLRRWWLMLTGCILLTLIGGNPRLYAQNITNYAFSASSGTFTSIVGTPGAVNLTSIQGDDVSSAAFPIGFTFTYMGVPYTTIWANSNGFLGLGSTIAAGATYNPGLSTGGGGSRPIIAPLWDDQNGAGGAVPGVATYVTTGSPGSRVFTMEWLNWRWTWSGPVAISYQAKLYEGSGVIEFVYRPEGTPATGSASIGITAVGTGAGNFLSLDGTGASPGVSSTTETSNISTNPANGQVYTFTPPPAPASPTNLSFTSVSASGMTLNWTDVTGESGYLVQRSLDGVNYTTVGTLAADVTSFAASGLFSNTIYYWNVIAFTEGASSAPLNGSQSTSAGTICGTYTVGPTGTYPTLTDALADIRTNGPSCSVILELQAAYTSSSETFPIWTGLLGSGPSTTVTIRPEAGATGLLISSSNALGTVLDSLSTYVIIDGRPGGTGSASELTIQNINNTSSTTTAALRITTESSNNTCQYVIFRGANPSTTGGVIIIGGTTAGGFGNDNNSFDNCDVREFSTTFPVNGIFASGTSGAANDNLSITNCRVYNFFAPGTATVGINILGNNNTPLISGNRIFQDAPRTYGTAAVHKGIVFSNTGSSATITNNVIGYGSANGTGTYSMAYVGTTTAIANRFFAMDLNVANSPASTITGNEIASFSINTSNTGTNATASFCGIWLNAGSANISNNTIGSLTGTDNILVRGTGTSGSATTASLIGIGNVSGALDPISITNNNIGGLGFNGVTAALLPSATVGASVVGIYNAGFSTLTTGSSALRTITGNTIGGNGVAASMRSGNANQAALSQSANFSVIGVLNTGTANLNIANNTIQNLFVPTRSTSGVVYGVNSTSGINTISGNTIRNLSTYSKNTGAGTSAVMNGINHTATTAPVAGTQVLISQNTISNLKIGSDSTVNIVNGIAFSGSTNASFDYLVERNLVYDMGDLTQSTDTAKAVYSGIGLFGGLAQVRNNMISIGDGNAKGQIYFGINKNTTNVNRIYHNSVYIGGSTTIASGVLSGASAAFRRQARPTSGNDELVNNIFYNARTTTLAPSPLAGVDYHYGVWLDTTVNIVASKNIYFADTLQGGRVGRKGASAVSSISDGIGLAAWRTVSGLDLTSIYEDPKYVDPAASTPDLHLQAPPVAVPAEAAGQSVASVAEDFDGEDRAAFTPVDIGADAGNFIASGDYANPIIYSVTNSLPAGQCVATNRSITAVVNDASGFASVVINWSLNGVAQTAIAMVNVSDSTWSGTIPASGNALVSFSVTATDASVNANVATSASQSYTDEYLASGLSAGADQTICPGASTTLTVSSSFLNSILFTEISGFESGSTGAGTVAPGITGFDYIELTNIGNLPVDISGWRLEVVGTTPGVYIIPSGNVVPAGGTFTIARTGGGAAIPGFYVNSTLLSVSSSTSQGFILSSTTGQIVDVVAINGGNPVGAGTPAATASMWSGTIPSASGTAGIRRTAAADNNSASDWTVASATNQMNWGVINAGLGLINVATISWSSGGTSSTETVSPTVSPSEYIVTISDGICSASDTVVVNLFTTLPAPIGNDGTHCGNQVPVCSVDSLPGATAYRWYDVATGGTALQDGPSRTFLSPIATTTTFYVAAFDGTCEGPRVAVTETVTPPVPVDIQATSGSLTQCLGGSVTLTAGTTNTNYTFVWTGNGTSTLDINSGATVISTPTTAGSITLVVVATDAIAGCATTDTVVIVTNNAPVLSVDPVPASICEGDSVSLSGFAYTVAAGGGSSPSYCASGATNPADTKIQSVTLGTLSNSTSPTACETYTDYTSLPAPVLAPGQTYSASITHGSCGGFYGGYSKMWIDFNQNGTFDEPAELVLGGTHTSVNSVVSGNVTIPLTALNGTTRMRVVLNESGSATQSACGTFTYGETEDYTVLIASTSNVAYSWTPTTGLANPNAATTQAAPATSTVYTLTVTDTDNGCTSSSSVSVTVNPAPAAPTANNSTQCGTAVPTASVNAVAGATAYYWFDAASGGTILQADPSLTYLSSVSATTTFYVASFDGNCLSTTRTPVTITVSAAPAILASADDSLVCEGTNTITLTETLGNYPTITWSVNAGGALNSSSGSTVTASPSTAGTYTYTVTGTDGFCTNTDDVVVVVGAFPTAPSVINISDNSICQGGTVTLTVPVSTGGGGNLTYCPSGASSSADTKIQAVTLGTLNNSTAPTACETYTNYTSSVAAPTLVPGQTYTASVTHGSCSGTWYGGYSRMFIDFNQNGVFDEPSEVVLGGSHDFLNAVVSGTVSIPLNAVPGNTRMRVVLDEGGFAPGPGSCATFTWGETEDYTVFIAGNIPGAQVLTYSWGPAGSVSPTTGTTTTFTGSTIGQNSVVLTVADSATGCAITVNNIISVGEIAVAPTCAGDTVCGQGDVTLTATAAGSGQLVWTENNGGNILGIGNSLTKTVTTGGVDYVRELPANLDTTAVGYDPIGNPTVAVGYFPTTTQGMWFYVDNPEGVIIKSVDIFPNGPVGSNYAIAIIDSLGNTIGTASGVTTVTNLPAASGGTTPPFNGQTVDINIFVPFSTTPYAIRPIANPNLLVHQNVTVQASAPWQIVGDIRIQAYGNMPPTPSFFGTNTFGFFYNWQVMHGCFGPACAANYVVNPAPALNITAGGTTIFCATGDTNVVTLDAATNSDPSYVNFNWQPATGLNTTTGSTVTASVTTTSTYIVTANDGVSGGCVNSDTITITVNTAPFVSTGAVPDTICNSTALQLNGSGGPGSYKFIGGTESPGQTAGWPFNGANTSQKMDVYISKNELNAAGIFGPSFLNSVGFNVVSKLSNQPYSNFTVSIDTIPTGFGCFFSTNHYVIPTTNTVFQGNYSTVAGWNDIVFQTPYFWDGVHDLVLQTCFTNATTSFFDIVYTTQTSGCSSTNATNASACSATTGTLSNLRPNMRFQGGAVNYSWSPATELSNANIANPVFTGTGGVGPRTLVVTVTDPSNNCTASDTVDFYVNSAPSTPSISFVGNDTTACLSGTVTFAASFIDGSLLWQESADGTTFTDIAGATNDTLVRSFSAPTYVRVKAFCADSSFSNVKFIEVFNPTVLTTEGDTVCGQGNVTLTATANSGYFLQWFADSLSAIPLVNNGTLNTFIAQTDTFWVRATIDTNSVFGGGTPPSYCATSNAGSACITNVTFNTLNYGSAGCSGTNNQNIVDESTATTQVLIGQSYNLSVTCDGSAITSVWIDYNKDGVYDASEWQQVYTAATTGSISITIPATALGGKTGMRIRSRLSGNPNGAGDGCTSLGSGETEDFVITIGSSACSSPKIPVVAVATPPPALTVTPSAATICEGGSVTLDITAGAADYTNFDWSPATGLSSSTGTSVVANPTVSTSYIVTASGNLNGCVNSDTAVITVNAAPVFSLSSSTNSVCGGGSVNLSATITSPVGGTYTVASIPHAPVAPSSPTAGPTGDDSQAAGIPLPFQFVFNGVSQSTVNIFTNGYIQFGTTSNNTATYGATIPTATAPNNIVALAWEDLNVTTGNIQYWTDGVAPNRRFVVAYNNVLFWSASGDVTGQIVLNEGSNTIDMFLTNIDQAGTNSSVCGIENASGTYGLVAPGRQFGSWGAGVITNEGWRFAPVPAASISWTGPGIQGASNTTSITASPSVSSYYVATVTNPLTGCTKSDSVLVNASANPTPRITTNDTTLCNPAQIYIKVADIGAYSSGYPAGTTFTWKDATGATYFSAADVDSISSTSGSSFYVDVILPSGCFGRSDTSFVLTKAVSVTSNSVNATCVGANGSIDVEVVVNAFNGVQPPYNFVWSTDAAQTNIVKNVTKTSTQDTLSGLSAGTYYLQVFDAAGSPASCNSGVIPFTITSPPPIVVSGTGTDVLCNGGFDGTASISWTGGSAPYTVAWSDNVTTTENGNTANRSSLIGGVYTVTVSDGQGCSGSTTVTINEPSALTVTLSSTVASSSVATDGSVTAVATGGTGPYSYDWFDELLDGAGSGSTVTGLGEGLYICLVTDANGCNTLDPFADSIRVNYNMTMNVTMLFEGFYDGAGTMKPVLSNAGIGLSTTEADSVVLQLRDAIDYSVLFSTTAVMGTNGLATATISSEFAGGSAYIAVKHRNAVQTWSAAPVSITGTGVVYNFTTAATQAFGDNQANLGAGFFGFFSGDVNQDDVVDVLDQIDVDNDASNLGGGYVSTDLDGDGVVDILDQIILDNNAVNFVGAFYPF